MGGQTTHIHVRDIVRLSAERQIEDGDHLEGGHRLAVFLSDTVEELEVLKLLAGDGAIQLGGRTLTHDDDMRRIACDAERRVEPVDERRDPDEHRNRERDAQCRS